MKYYAMHPPPYLFVLLARVVAASVALLFSLPSDAWAIVIEMLEVPDQVKVFINPLLGSICITILGALNEYRKKASNPAYVIPHEPGWVFPAKIFVGWVVGGISVPLFATFIKASEPTIAFYAGAAGTTFLSVYVANLIKKFDNDSTNQND